MPASRKQMHLNLFLNPAGHHAAAWRHPQAAPDRITDLSYYRSIAKRAEAAKFDAIFLADSPAIEDCRFSARIRLEPLTWLAALAGATEKIGLIGTATTTYSEPYNIARQFATLDHLSGGRAGWNIVTTWALDAARNYGLEEHPCYASRYERANEFTEVVSKLWDSWEDDAVIADRDTGRYADTDKIHDIAHVGQTFKVRGPLTMPRSPQGRPVFVQAGASGDGRAFAARFAEMIFAPSDTFKVAREFYRDIRAQAVALGRSPDQITILPGICPYIGSTEAEARRAQEEMNALISPRYWLDMFRGFLGVDLDAYDLDDRVPLDLIPRDGERGLKSRFQSTIALIERERLTIRQLMDHFSGALGHWVPVGTPDQIVDQMQFWFENGACDGFNIMPPYLTGGFDPIVNEIIPILRRRGLFRTDYTGRTLREHLGLDRPRSQFEASQATAGSVETV